MKKLIFIFLSLLLVISCSEEVSQKPPLNLEEKNLTIFFINDQHGQLENFAKIKHIVDAERASTNVILACSGDIFSGNPVVDYYSDRGFPIIDVMNDVGFDISVIGNHEFDYGEDVLAKRMKQAQFEWICANVDMGNSGVPQPSAYKTITVGDVKVSFLGLVETNGKQNGTIPSTHPGRVKDMTFNRPENVVNQYMNVKATEDADLYVALTHLGRNGGSSYLGDFQLAEQFPAFDLIIGGHSHRTVDARVNDIPVFQTNGYLRNLGKIELVIKNQKIESLNYTSIDLDSYTSKDEVLASKISSFNTSMSSVLDTKIGVSAINHGASQLGCFYTDVLVEDLSVDISFQNGGGIRSGLDAGDITKREIYEIDPFNNNAHIYQFTVGELITFLKGANSGFYYSGLQISQNGSDIEIRNNNGDLLEASTSISLGINDYIPAVYDNFFTTSPNIQPFTTAELLINHLENRTTQVSYSDCQNYFEYQ